MANKILLFSFTIVLFCTSAFGQSQLGMRLSNFSGVGGMQLNPAHNLSSRQTWEAQLGGGYFFGDNNYFFVENSSLLDLWSARKLDASLYERPDLSPGEVPAGEKVFVIDYKPGTKTRYGSFAAAIMGPGFMVNLESGHTFGAFSNLRFAGGSHQVPEGFSYFPYFDQKFGDPFVVEPFEGAIMAWGEIGVNYGFSVETYNGRMGFGMNLKALSGLEAFYFKSEERVDFTKFPDNEFSSNVAQLRFGYTSSNLDLTNISPTVNGWGIGADLGFTYIIEGFDEAPEWRFGASILDIGSINFRNNSNPQLVSSDSLIYIDGDEYAFFNGLDDIPGVVRKFSEQALRDSLLSSTGTGYKVWTPSAINLSADYSINEYFFVNATLIQRLPIGDLAVSRDNVLAVVPRFEHKWFEASLPIVLVNYDQLHIGLVGRLGFFTVGTDNIASLLGKSNLSGMDFYVGVKIPGFIVESSDRVPPSSKRRRGKGPKCYQF